VRRLSGYEPVVEGGRFGGRWQVAMRRAGDGFSFGPRKGRRTWGNLGARPPLAFLEAISNLLGARGRGIGSRDDDLTVLPVSEASCHAFLARDAKAASDRVAASPFSASRGTVTFPAHRGPRSRPQRESETRGSRRGAGQR
jgi:hypothetical protein